MRVFEDYYFNLKKRFFLKTPNICLTIFSLKTA